MLWKADLQHIFRRPGADHQVVLVLTHGARPLRVSTPTTLKACSSRGSPVHRRLALEERVREVLPSTQTFAAEKSPGPRRIRPRPSSSRAPPQRRAAAHDWLGAQFRLRRRAAGARPHHGVIDRPRDLLLDRHASSGVSVVTLPEPIEKPPEDIARAAPYQVPAHRVIWLSIRFEAPWPTPPSRSPRSRSRFQHRQEGSHLVAASDRTEG